MQDPLISASLTDTVMHCLQNYITDYRTNKARPDLAFTEKLYGEAKASYESAQKKYANFGDANPVSYTHLLEGHCVLCKYIRRRAFFILTILEKKKH